MEGVSRYFQNKNKKEKIISQLVLPAASHLWCRCHDSGQCRASLQSLRPLPVDPKEEKKQLCYLCFSKQNQNKSTHFLTSGSRLYAKLLALGQDSQPVLEEEKSAAEESPGGRAGGGRRGTIRTRRRGGRATADPAATAEESAASAVAEGDN